jgi:Holliday junction resolvase RusA-like endonuclease
MDNLKFTIPVEVPSLNKLLRMHWAKRGRLRMDIVHEIWAASGCALPHVREKRVKEVRITSYRKKLLDADNLTGGAKIHVDALKSLGMIYDDSPAWIELHVEQVKDGKNPRTEIEVI